MISVIQFYFIQRWVKLQLGWFEEERSGEHSVELTEHSSAVPWRSWSVQALCLKSLEITLDPLQG